MRVPIDATQVERAGHLLRAGGLVAFPTETVYGLGANALNADAVARIYEVKRRPPTSPLIVHVDSLEMAQRLVEWNELAERLAEEFWPGPLTMVLPKAGYGLAIPALVSANLPTIGVRMPAHPTAHALIKAATVPLAAPSANRFTEVSPTTAEHVRKSLGSEVDMILDGGSCEVGIESSVISLAGDVPMLLRPGGVSRASLEALIGPLRAPVEASQGGHASPGLHPKHYSPRTPLYLVANGNVPDSGRGIYLHLGNPLLPDLPLTKKPVCDEVVVCRMSSDPREYAASLYKVLHDSDAGRYDWIAVERPPADQPWEAILDRLTRAAAKT